MFKNSKVISDSKVWLGLFGKVRASHSFLQLIKPFDYLVAIMSFILNFSPVIANALSKLRLPDIICEKASIQNPLAKTILEFVPSKL